MAISRSLRAASWTTRLTGAQEHIIIVFDALVCRERFDLGTNLGRQWETFGSTINRLI